MKCRTAIIAPGSACLALAIALALHPVPFAAASSGKTEKPSGRHRTANERFAEMFYTSGGEKEPARDKQLIEDQIFTDMFYGTDDCFGENRDLGYADSVEPSGRLAPVEREIEKTVTSADRMVEAGDYSSAYDAYRSILTMEPQYVKAHADELVNAGSAFLTAGDTERAAEFSTTILAQDNDNAGALMLNSQIETLVAEREREAELAAEQALLAWQAWLASATPDPVKPAVVPVVVPGTTEPPPDIPVEPPGPPDVPPDCPT